MNLVKNIEKQIAVYTRKILKLRRMMDKLVDRRGLNISSGIKRAKRRGVKIGRPTITKSQMWKIATMKVGGHSMRDVSRKTGLSLGCVCRYWNKV